MQLIGRRSENLCQGRIAVLRRVDHFLWMLDAEKNGKRLLFHLYYWLALVQHGECVTGAVPDGQDQVLCRHRELLPVRNRNLLPVRGLGISHCGQFSAGCGDAFHTGAEPDLAPCLLDSLPDGGDDRLQLYFHFCFSACITDP